MTRLLLLETYSRNNLQVLFHRISRCNISTAAERVALLLIAHFHHFPFFGISGCSLAV